MSNKDMIPAIPPDDYSGSQADWMVALVSRGLWDDSDGSWHGDIMITEDVWQEILEECEGEEDSDDNEVENELNDLANQYYDGTIGEGGFKYIEGLTKEEKNKEFFRLGFLASFLHFSEEESDEPNDKTEDINNDFPVNNN